MATVTRRNDLPRRLGDRVLIIVGALAVIAVAVAPFVLDQGILRLFIEVLVVLAMAQMWNLLAGYAGLMSIDHQAFVGVGAYGLFTFSNYLGASPYYSVLVAPVLCAVLAAVLAPVLFRLRDAYFSIGIWVVAEIIAILVGKYQVFGRQYGMTLIGIRTLNREWFGPIAFWMAGALALASIVSVLWLLRTRVGLGLMAVRDNEAAAASLGIDVWRSRFVAFVISAAGCGLGGAIYYMAAFQVVPTSAFAPNWVVEMLFITIIGGMGRIEGPIVGTIVYFALREYFAQEGTWYLILMGAVAVFVMLVAPQGIWGSFSAWARVELLSVRRTPPGAAGHARAAPTPAE